MNNNVNEKEREKSILVLYDALMLSEYLVQEIKDSIEYLENKPKTITNSYLSIIDQITSSVNELNKLLNEGDE